ncbi:MULTISPECIES: UDP-glucose 4-epimerase GalE [Pseudomonas]|uniref:UDP-glucose 4-epimerase n=1 Tax=Pseudomonas taiwanensis SJ9 TaxID=1388762 RepID=V7D7G8_9PSED|nr:MULTISPECIES: UDP-glucose 4-epimerase GalE [Pseudomonas]ESW38244.1 UDP-glucose 4-epimerase [Pseudomonas taiwanensis SJ9]MBH3377818.1 UDP-glucose 4-epimerase GalE [Pseudomonas asiatica]MBO2891222.1 UDP-glucose 4-epimerase GalE [Pseudomonas asiatica]
MNKILIVGGAGYIGSHMVWHLGQLGKKIVVLDNLSSGHEDAILHGEFVHGDLSDQELLDDLFKRNTFEAVIHFASSIQVGESMTDPKKYYKNNLVNGLNLLDAMLKHGVYKIIFSSTAAIFGNPIYTPIDEAHPKNPINTYGHTKLMFEQILADYDRAYGLKSVCLRYFNAAGCHPDGILGERHDPETHLIPLVLETASGERKNITVYGEDYDTQDGTCIRDYIHVLDLAEAHWLALKHLMEGGKSEHYNLGNGNGYSVSEVIRTVEHVTAKSVNIQHGSRRTGDPAVLVANSEKIRNELGWNPKFANLADIVQHAWLWHSHKPTN